jgi:hypothetical protein
MKHRPSHRHHARDAANGGAARAHIIATAARIMAEEGVNDFSLAKRRATQRLGLPEGRNLPGNQEIEDELKQYLALFHGPRLNERVARLRRIALEAMHFFARFEPRLVGAALSGVVTPTSAVQLHVGADAPEDIGFVLAEHGIPYEQETCRLRFGGERQEEFPAYHFSADGVSVQVCVLSPTAAREAPLSPIDGKPMRRAALREVEQLLTPAP